MSDIDSSPKHATATTRPEDVDTTNYLYINEVPQVDGDKQGDLNRLLSDILAWQFWEVNKVEETVRPKLDSQQLPSDDSNNSVRKRAGYRAKVVNFLRNNQAWLVRTQSDVVQNIELPSSEERSKASFNLRIVSALTRIPTIEEHPSYLPFVRAIGAGLVHGDDPIQPNHHTVVSFRYEPSLEAFEASVTWFQFLVKYNEVERRRQSRFGEDEGLEVTATIEISTTTARFDSRLWESAAPPADSPYRKRDLPEQRIISVLTGSKI